MSHNGREPMQGWQSIVVLFVCFSLLAVVVGWYTTRRTGGLRRPWPWSHSHRAMDPSRVTVGELEALTARFVGEQRARAAFSQYDESCQPSMPASPALIDHTERVLADVFGTSSARLVLNSALQGCHLNVDDVATIVDEASQLYDFSRGLLQGSIEHISQGLSVVDKHLRLVAWNQRYLELFEFPPELIQVGRPIADIIRFNAEHGFCGPGDVEEHVNKRVRFLQQGHPHTSARQRPDGKVIEVQGNPMPGGGFVMSFNDITTFRQVEQRLKEANEYLEERVLRRTQELENLNKQLVQATQRAEHESRSKSRFLAAVSHDLMQPLNAARLFSSSLADVAKQAEASQLAQHIERSLLAAEELISDLLDISRLESGQLAVHPRGFLLNEVLQPLNAEFSASALQHGIEFVMVPSSVRVKSDPRLLRRVIQNFLTNAFRYAAEGKIVLGVRHVPQGVSVEVWDNGMGIEEEKQAVIFDEFTRGTQTRSDQGLGLGLAISKGIAQVLGHKIQMRSWPGKGSVFSLTLHRDDSEATLSPPMERRAVQESTPSHDVAGLRVLCVDNDTTILDGMAQLLSRWGCEVRVATDIVSSLQVLEQYWVPDVILSDYRLENQRTGLEVLQQFRLRLGSGFTGVVISADRTPDILDTVDTHGFSFIAKPVKPLKLRSLLMQHVRKEGHE